MRLKFKVESRIKMTASEVDYWYERRADLGRAPFQVTFKGGSTYRAYSLTLYAESPWELFDQLSKTKRLRHMVQVWVPWSARARNQGYTLARRPDMVGGKGFHHSVDFDEARLNAADKEARLEYLEGIACHCWEQAVALVCKGSVKPPPQEKQPNPFA